MNIANIMNKLKATDWYPMFVRHKNGDTLDNRVENLEMVHIMDAFQHITEWKVGWISYITDAERSFLVDILTPVPEVYRYIRWRADKEETGFDLSPSFLKNNIHRGVREYFGVRIDNTGNVLEDRHNPGFVGEFKTM
jgi:hypothetical protein